MQSAERCRDGEIVRGFRVSPSVSLHLWVRSICFSAETAAAR